MTGVNLAKDDPLCVSYQMVEKLYDETNMELDTQLEKFANNIRTMLLEAQKVSDEKLKTRLNLEVTRANAKCDKRMDLVQKQIKNSMKI